MSSSLNPYSKRKEGEEEGRKERVSRIGAAPPGWASEASSLRTTVSAIKYKLRTVSNLVSSTFHRNHHKRRIVRRHLV